MASLYAIAVARCSAPRSDRLAFSELFPIDNDFARRNSATLTSISRSQRRARLGHPQSAGRGECCQSHASRRSLINLPTSPAKFLRVTRAPLPAENETRSRSCNVRLIRNSRLISAVNATYLALALAWPACPGILGPVIARGVSHAGVCAELAGARVKIVPEITINHQRANESKKTNRNAAASFTNHERRLAGPRPGPRTCYGKSCHTPAYCDRLRETGHARRLQRK